MKGLASINWSGCDGGRFGKATGSKVERLCYSMWLGF